MPALKGCAQTTLYYYIRLVKYSEQSLDCSLVNPHLTSLSLLPCPSPLPSSAYSCPTFASTTVTFNSKPSSPPTYFNKVVSSRQFHDIERLDPERGNMSI